jgi:hypothetical protein
VNNEFGYTFNKPFKNVDYDRQCYTIINISDDYIELKINDVDIYDVFNSIPQAGKIIEPKTVYCVDSKFNSITTFNTCIKDSSYSAIPHSTLYSNMYVKSNNHKDEINHFDENTKIKKMYFYHNDLINIFPNLSMTIKHNLYDSKKKYINVEVKRTKDVKLGTIKTNNNEIKVFLVNSFISNGNVKNISVTPTACLRLEFKNFIHFEEVHKIKKRIDSVIHMLIFTDKRCVRMEFFDTKKRSYTYYDLKKKNDNKDLTLSLFDRKSINNIFIALLNYFINIKEEDSNGFFPFFQFDSSKVSLEIQFLEYYRALEFIDTERRKKIGKGQNKLFMTDIIKKYPFLKNKYFGNKSDEDIGDEIRSLRNYYSHSGYYVDNLPIPTEKPKRYMNIDVQWKFDVKSFTKLVSYLEIYSVVGIIVDEKNSSIYNIL